MNSTNKRKTIYFFAFFILYTFLIIGCVNKSSEEKIRNIFNNTQGNFALAFKDLHSREEIFINEKESFHAASTMKTPVMIEVFKQANEGKFSLYDSILVKNEFKSIVDGSIFSLSDLEDSEKNLYQYLGSNRSIYSLVEDMITVSSNFATNLIIDFIDVKNVNKTMREIGAMDINVLRGVEDIKAYDKGLSNTTTAYDLMLIYEQLANRKIISKDASDKMIEILIDQEFDDIIPFHLPKNVRVAHKTGMITGVHHDSGIVFLPNGRKYVLILLSKNLDDIELGTSILAEVSKIIYDDLTK